MRIKTVSLDLLIPIEVYIAVESTVQRMFESFKPQSFGPISVIEYQEREKLYLMGDGHHRATYCYLAGLPATIKVLETDEEVRVGFTGIFQCYGSVDNFISKYQTEYKERCKKCGIFSIKDLVENQARRRPDGFIAAQLRKQRNAQSRTPHPQQ